MIIPVEHIALVIMRVPDNRDIHKDIVSNSAQRILILVKVKGMYNANKHDI